MNIDRKKLGELLEEAWCKGFARGILKDREGMDDDVLDILSDYGQMAKIEREHNRR